MIHARAVRSGMTLIEILVVLAILATLAAVVGPRYMAYRRQAKVHKAKTELRTYEFAIQSYDSSQGKFPESWSDLIKEKLIKAKEAPKDPWGRAYVYRRNPEGAEEPYELYSKGEDGKSKLSVQQQ